MPRGLENQTIHRPGSIAPVGPSTVADGVGVVEVVEWSHWEGWAGRDAVGAKCSG